METSKHKYLVISLISLGCLLFCGFLYFFLKEINISQTVKNSTISLSEGSYSGREGSPIYPDANLDSTVKDFPQEKDIIRNGSISMSADNMDTTLKRIQSLSTESSASTTSLQDFGKGSDRQIYITIKVEEAKFQTLFNSIKGLENVEFNSSTVSEVEITETVQDLEIRLENLRSVETQLAEILKQAKTVTDTLAVQKELATTRSEIELIQADLKNMERQTSYSLISINITQSASGTSLSDDQWRPLGVLKDAGRALVEFGKFLVNALIWIVVFSPIALAIIIPVVIIQKKAKKVV